MTGRWPGGGDDIRGRLAEALFLLALTDVSGAVPIRNVILCIGDGMGAGQVAAAHCYSGSNLFFESFPYQSWMTTGDAGGFITDSAAASTAIATGRKVYSGVISLALPGDAVELETLLEHFKKAGKSTGLVTTSYLTDATPASFGAHENSRFNSAQIASDYLCQTRPDVLLGGGYTGLDSATVSAAGYSAVTDRVSLAELNAAGIPRVCGLFGFGYLPFEYDGVGTLPSLSEMAGKALEVLNGDPDGFFLMIEGGLIDIACHGNDLPRCVGETLAFDAAVKKIVEWADGRGDTLVLVMADHETGGLAVTHDNGPGVLPDVLWTTTGHTGSPVALYGWGVNAYLAGRVSDNTQVASVARSRVPQPGESVGFERIATEYTTTLWATASGGVYRVEYAATLSPSAWHPCGTVTASSSRVTFVHSNTVHGSQGFYRMISEQP